MLLCQVNHLLIKINLNLLLAYKTLQLCKALFHLA